jgi:hypothetical protein
MNISHGCFAGSRESFDGLRLLWSEVAGIGWYDFRSQGGPVTPRLDFSQFSEDDLLGEWPGGAPDDPLIILLVHDESGGRIKAGHCSYIADRLDELVSLLLKQDRMHWVLITQQFSRGLRNAASYKQDVIFSP